MTAWLRPAIVLCLLALMVFGSVPAKAGFDLLDAPVAHSALTGDNTGSCWPDGLVIAPECALHVACHGMVLSVAFAIFATVSSPKHEPRTAQFLTGITAPPLPRPPNFF